MRSVTALHASKKVSVDAFASAFRAPKSFDEPACATSGHAGADERKDAARVKSRDRGRMEDSSRAAVLSLDALKTTATSLPVHSFEAMNDWVFAICGAPVTNPTAVVAALDGLTAKLGISTDADVDADVDVGGGGGGDVSVTIATAISVARAWMLFMSKVSAFSDGGAVTKPSGMAMQQSADGIALDLFLEHAAKHAWVSHRDAVFKDDHGVASHVGSVRDLLLKICAETTPWVHEYLVAHVVATQGVVHVLCSGAHDRFPLVVLDTACVAFSDVLVRMTTTGLSVEALRRLGAGVTTTPRVYVPCPLGDAQTASRAAVCSLFPVPGRDCILRSLGALLQPRTARQSDRWTTVLVATGPTDASFVLHPVEWLLRTFVGMSVVTSLHGINVADRRPGGPIVLLLTASPSGTLTPDQQSQIVLASVSDICTVVRSPFIPACMCVNEGLRLASVVVDVRSFPTQEQYDAAMPHVLPVLTGIYGVTPFERRQLVTPIFDKESLACRLGAPVAQSAVALFCEMLQSGFGVRMVPRMHADLARVRTLFNEYQDIRGYTGFATTSLSAEDVVEASAVVCTYFPCLKPCGDAVQWARSTETFVNLALL